MHYNACPECFPGECITKHQDASEFMEKLMHKMANGFLQRVNGNIQDERTHTPYDVIFRSWFIETGEIISYFT